MEAVGRNVKYMEDTGLRIKETSSSTHVFLSMEEANGKTIMAGMLV